VRIEAKPLQPADTDDNDDDTPKTYLEADTQRTVGIPRAAAAAAATTTTILKLLCSGKAEKKGAGKTERVQDESQKREREEAEEADAEEKYKAKEAAG
jgi:hypothetical protein